MTMATKPRSMNHVMKATNIDWETDGETVDLPENVKIPRTVERDDVADYLSDTYGWLVNSFDIE